MMKLEWTETTPNMLEADQYTIEKRMGCWMLFTETNDEALYGGDLDICKILAQVHYNIIGKKNDVE